MRLVVVLMTSIALAATPGWRAMAQISLGFNTPSLSIGVSIPMYPDG